MNKLITKIVGVALGLSMATGVGVAVAKSNRDAVPVHAASNVITFTTASGDGSTLTTSTTAASTVSSGASYLTTTPYSSITKAYGPSDGGLKLGASSNAGSVTITLSESITPTSVVVNAKRYNSSKAVTLNVNSVGAQDLTSAFADYTYEITTSISSLTLASSKYCYVASITINYSSGPVQLSAPTNLAYDSNTQKVSWDAVSNASSYQYSYDDSTYTATGNSGADREVDVSSLTKDVQATIYVKAIGDGTSYSTSSAASLSFTPTATPTYSGVVLTKGSLTGSYKGSAYIQCSAEVQGTNNPSQTVIWYLTSTNTYGTTTSVSNVASIDSNGKVTFLDNTNGVYVWALAADGSTHNSTGLEVSASGLADAPGAESNPYTVAQAFDAIDNSGNVNGVYATGIVSSIYTAWSTQYNNISFYISDDGTTSGNQLEAFRAVSGTVTLTEADNIKVGDVVTIAGNLTKYGSTYEFAAACTVEVRKHISSVTVTTAPTKTTYDAGESFAPAGLVVTATYDDASTKAYSYASTASLFSFDKTTLVKTDTSVAITMFGEDSNEYKTSQVITVNAVAAVLSVTVTPDTLSLDIGDSDTLSVVVEVDAGAAQTVNWSSSNTNIATVDENGEVTAVARGSATITATSTFDNTKSDDCVVTVTDPNISEYTWDLTTNEFDSSTTNAVVWSCSAATVTVAKGTSSTAANNYIGGENNRTSTRILYSGQTLTFAPNATYSISAIYLTKTAGTDYSTASWTNGSASISGSVITVIPTDGTSSVSVTGTAYIGLTAMGIEYTQDKTVKNLSINDSELSVAVGGTATTTLVETNFSGGTYTVDTNACATVSVSDTTVTVTGVAAGSYQFTITETTNSLSVTLDVTVYDPANVYTKITDVTNLVEGSRIYIGNATGAFLMGSKNESKDYYEEIATGETQTAISGSNSYVSYLVGTDSNGYYFKNEGNNTYLKFTGNSNEMTTSDSYDASDSTIHWTVSISNGEATVTNVGTNTRTIRHNSSSTRFACYLNQGQNPISLYVRNVAGVTSAQKVETFSNLYMHKLDIAHNPLDGDSGNCYGTDGSDGYFAKARTALTGEWASIAEAFSQSGNMWDRYVAWGERCGVTVTYNNGIQYNSRAISPLLSITSEAGKMTSIIVIVSLISLTAVGGYFFMKKKKEQ